MYIQHIGCYFGSDTILDLTVNETLNTGDTAAYNVTKEHDIGSTKIGL